VSPAAHAQSYPARTVTVVVPFPAGGPSDVVARIVTDQMGKMREFVAYVKKNGDKVKQAHGGVGASSHMACLLFNTAAGTKPTLVAYRGTGPAMNDLVGGHVDFLCEQAVSVAPQVSTGAIKAYAMSGSERLPALPNVPTAKEAAVNYQMSIWAGIFAPKGTPKEIIDKLATALDKALDDPGVKKRIAELGGSLPAKKERNPVAFEAFVKAEIARWSPILKAATADAK
jgi:tripartite-type tricarboxylate transporter receptor subunit TctC